MTPQALQSLRRLLFFTTAEAAQVIGGVAERSWRYWEAGGRSVPDDVVSTIRTMLEYRAEVIDCQSKPVLYASAREFARATGEDESFFWPYCSAMAEIEARRIIG